MNVTVTMACETAHSALKNMCIGVTLELEAEHNYRISHIYWFLNRVTDVERHVHFTLTQNCSPEHYQVVMSPTSTLNTPDGN